jgi:VWFA-related protein
MVHLEIGGTFVSWNLSRRAFGFVLAGLPLAAAKVQEPFKIVDDVDLVLLDVSVQDSRGGYVTDLPKDAFHISVDGKPQTISQFSRVDAPVTIGLIVDNSGSMRYKRKEVVLSGLAFAKESNPKDEFFVVNFNNTVQPGLPANEPFTDSLALLHKALYMGQSVGQTALYDAIGYGLKHLQIGHHDKRTLIVVSDGGDNVSHLNQATIVDLIERSSATVYTIGILDPQDSDLQPNVLKKFAHISGGEYFQPREMDDVPKVLNKISQDIRSRYSIGFNPPPSGPGRQVHQIKVAAHGEGRKLIVRTRTSYTTYGH